MIEQAGATIARFNPFGSGMVVLECGQARQALRVLIAKTDEHRMAGLSFIREAPPGYDGMLFEYPIEREAAFSMANTYLPLRISFFDRDGLMVASMNGEPRSEKAYRADMPFQFVLETFWFVSPPVEGARLKLIAQP